MFVSAVLVSFLCVAGLPADGFARGFGGCGGFHGGGFGGFHGGSFGGGGFDRGSFGGAEHGSYGGFDRGGYGGFDHNSYGGAEHSSYGGFDRGSYGGFDRSSYGGSLNRGDLNSFLGLPTDGGMHAAGGASVAHVSAGEHGAAVGPYGAAAGGRYAGATAVRGPTGNTYLHTSSAAVGYGTAPGRLPIAIPGRRRGGIGSRQRHLRRRMVRRRIPGPGIR